jgi:hypothetical protein
MLIARLQSLVDKTWGQRQGNENVLASRPIAFVVNLEPSYYGSTCSPVNCKPDR